MSPATMSSMGFVDPSPITTGVPFATQYCCP